VSPITAGRIHSFVNVNHLARLIDGRMTLIGDGCCCWHALHDK